VELTPITPTLLLPRNSCCAVDDFELSTEEIALRHRLELKVERALYRAAVVLQALHDGEDSASAHHYPVWGWQNEQKVQRAWGEIEVALQLLRDHQLYRSTHQNFDYYCRERFGSFVQDYSPIIPQETGICMESTDQSSARTSTQTPHLVDTKCSTTRRDTQLRRSSTNTPASTRTSSTDPAALSKSPRCLPTS